LVMPAILATACGSLAGSFLHPAVADKLSANNKDEEIIERLFISNISPS
jgi:hypothetical protein